MPIVLTIAEGDRSILINGYIMGQGGSGVYLAGAYVDHLRILGDVTDGNIRRPVIL